MYIKPASLAWSNSEPLSLLSMKQEFWQLKAVLFALLVALIEPAVPTPKTQIHYCWLPKVEGTEEPAEQD